ncbi:ATP-dependent RecD-like DNA helicase [Clostridium acetireducens DSM 10703]|uniref:ATP-dependent RecD2 DNA helicase n=1 Tax=Clostridium acetireducens DSM 10703 TaxID=1121290 RepID=A0A1E8EWL4_9CLOT|nr:ATP-dependent RecD-like DNA helicase [Clostridium acetireducens]OFI05029.1 ATP-dependent RecD-like DNA helicase [Clostridium acetireducens DSM 10703]
MNNIEGIVESIIFKNSDNGYVVAKIKEEKSSITIVGYMPYIKEGQNLKITGEWTIHPEFGQQFKAEVFEEIIPNTKLGIERYLSSGIIAGIGPVTAKKIVKKFGEDTLKILDNNINKLEEIEGIGPKKIKLIKKSYNKNKEIKNIMVFLQTYGITPNQCIKIYKRFGSESINIVKKNPYTLTEEIAGIGFKIADKIASSIGIEKESPFRIQSGIKYIINKFCSIGNTYIPLEKLLEKSVSILMVSKEIVEKNIYQCALDGNIKIETIEGENCVFDLLYYYCELGVTKKVLSLSSTKYESIDVDIDKEIEIFEKDNHIKFAESQKEAIRGAFENSMEIITGGPGTGKTTIINCIIDIFEKSNLKVIMGAPTGRAAKRMTESTGRESKTIHRILEMGIVNEEDIIFMKDENYLDCDVIVIDEASMIDIILMHNLLKAISLGTRVIIVGDSDQLPSVGPGNVLKDLIDSQCVKVVRLKDIFRQSKESMIIVNAHKINNGEMPVLNKKGKDFYFINCIEQKKILKTIVDLVDSRLPGYNSDWHKIKDIQVLSPMRKGIIGVSNLNSKLQQVLNPESKYKNQKEFRNVIFRVGDKVMQTKNNYCIKWKKAKEFGDEEGKGVYNGDLGYIKQIDDENDTVTVIFDDDREVEYDNLSLDELDLAYAMTVHKSQGSEFKVVILPVFMGPPMLMNRNLFYTAITRAKQLVVLVGIPKSIKFMINNNNSLERYSLLGWRIKNIIE